ncbi:MAG TPA: aldo/keto reductase [Negativicutes bacterium]|nr:aldo/keto reductase [Negativicutes bacterium]
MEYATLADLKVSKIIFGCESLGGTDWGKVDVPAVQAAVAHAWDRGVTTFDVADVYGLGRAETALAEALGSRRHDAVIVTKFGVNWRQGKAGSRAETFKDVSPAHARQAAEDSLRRLKIDCIPLYLVHWPDPRTPPEDTLGALEELKTAGKIRNYGLSNFPAAQIVKPAGCSGPVAAEFAYSLVNNGAAEKSLLAACRRQGTATLAYGVLAQGLLTGKYNAAATFAADDRRHRLSQFQQDSWEKNGPLLARLRETAERYGKTMAQVAIRWILDDRDVTCAIVGAKSVGQVDANLGTLGWRLTPEDYGQLGAEPS